MPRQGFTEAWGNLPGMTVEHGTFSLNGTGSGTTFTNLTGTRFSVTRSGTGTYLITLNDRFFGAYGVVVTPIIGSISGGFVPVFVNTSGLVSSPTQTQFSVLTYNCPTTGTPVLTDFNGLILSFVAAFKNSGAR